MRLKDLRGRWLALLALIGICALSGCHKKDTSSGGGSSSQSVVVIKGAGQ